MLCSDQFIFQKSDNRSHFHFLHECLARVAGNFENWYEKRDQAYIESSIISVEEEKYKRILPQIRNLFSDIQSDLESGKADKLILFNVQVLPLDN